MERKDLAAFLCLAEALHFGRAAQQLNITASTLSRVIQRLELEVETELFVRDRRSVTLTAAGELFIQYSLDVLAL